MHEEQVAPDALGDVAVAIEQHRPALRVNPMRLMLGLDVVDAAATLDLGVNELRRHRALGRNDAVNAGPILRAELHHPPDQ